MNLPPFLVAGHVEPIGRHFFSAEEIIRFARKYDPQIFHVDAEAAKATVLGGLCASGWHTVSVWMRKHRENSARTIAGLAALGFANAEFGPAMGFRNLRWMRPVYAGDEISFAVNTVECRPSSSRPGWYVLTAQSSGTNQKGEPVLSFESSVFVRYPA